MDVARRLVSIQPDPELVARIEELGTKANGGLLSDSEREEYEQFIADNELLAILQAKARKILRRQGE
jgi:hypothetical protein